MELIWNVINALKGMEMDLSLLHKSLKFLQFKYSTIEKATDCFDESNKLGHGGYGEIFKACTCMRPL